LGSCTMSSRSRASLASALASSSGVANSHGILSRGFFLDLALLAAQLLRRRGLLLVLLDVGRKNAGIVVCHRTEAKHGGAARDLQTLTNLGKQSQMKGFSRPEKSRE
jgi:hypothetical protein